MSTTPPCLLASFGLEAINLFDRNRLSRTGNLPEEGPAPFVTSHEVDQVVANNWCRNNGSGSLKGIGPEQFTGFSINAEATAGGGLHVNLAATYLTDDNRSMAGTTVTRHAAFPKYRPCFAIEGDHGCLLTTRRTDQPVAIDEDRLAVAP